MELLEGETLRHGDAAAGRAALAAAMRVAPGNTKTHVINEALREYARRRRVRRLLEFRGKVRWDGDLDELRRRTSRRH